MCGGLKMTAGKAELESLVKEAMEFAKNNRLEPTVAPRTVVESSVPTPSNETAAPLTIIEPSRLPSIGLLNSERDEIRQRISNFKAHQERFTRERQEYAASLLKRTVDRS
jgi:hypothetical protein